MPKPNGETSRRYREPSRAPLVIGLGFLTFGMVGGATAGWGAIGALVTLGCTAAACVLAAKG